MPIAVIDGIATHYEVVGDGPPLLMFAPGGFDARIEKWSDLGIYKRIRLLDHLPDGYRCILFDRRENGRSGGRVERITWGHFARQGLGLLDHLGIETAHMIGGCMGCCPITALATIAPHRMRSMVLYWPVGGAHHRISSHQRFATHLAFAEQSGLQAVVDRVSSSDKNFSADPAGGPWGTPIRLSEEFAATYAALDLNRYLLTVRAMFTGLFDRDTAPGADPEMLMQVDTPALIVPGADRSHATSAARYLQECLPGAQYWDIPVDAQTANNAPQRIATFLSEAEAAA